MHRALLILFAVGCAAEPPAQTFTHDTYYTGIVPPYATPEACEASDPNPITCHLELGFCAGGTAGFSNFDLPEQGAYHLEGAMVIATFASNPPDSAGQVIQLDTTTGDATDAEVGTYILDTAGRWQTLQFDSGVTCPQ